MLTHIYSIYWDEHTESRVTNWMANLIREANLFDIKFCFSLFGADSRQRVLFRRVCQEDSALRNREGISTPKRVRQLARGSWRDNLLSSGSMSVSFQRLAGPWWFWDRCTTSDFLRFVQHFRLLIDSTVWVWIWCFYSWIVNLF